MEITSPPQESLTGVPLAHIPEPFQRNGDPGPSAMAEPSSPPLPAKPEAAKKPPPPEPAGTAEVREIDRLIRSATQTAFQDTPEDSLLPPVTGEGIPGLKIKGIIFFAPGNASNHIFVATPENPNLKLRVGESVLDATLRSVYSSKAEFEYQGRRVELALGQ
ncbi:MAG: hypothetical protein GWM98_04535 [Nitrospinaceae bacterium]|nr:hypothetical protein [Nitrospinaceae bacterium]NIR53909.1 hypothetical protein [Nitrospinaceae bacterium]NIS84323.1 hypothetical protein [Nitrospinaceae bacterium]NIT81130.1 hypothetical protein [Nitrospinaceae bacterium]NIU43412.1 hypothetical protein [Nitrospinaceae bacterium]